MNLKSFVASVKRGEVLLPRIRDWLVEQETLQREGKASRKDRVIKDATLTIECFKERIGEFNHGEFKGQFFHPSQLGACMRQKWLEEIGLGHSSDPNPDSLMRDWLVFETGTYLHVMFQNLCQMAGFLISRESAIVDVKLRILGHADGILEIDGTRYLLEIKTSNSRNYTALRAVKDAHKRQVHAYMKSLKLTRAVVVYIDKDRGEAKEFVVLFDQAYYDVYVAERIDDFFKRVENGLMPDREGANPNAMPCSYCQFQRICYEKDKLNEIANQLWAKKMLREKKGKKLLLWKLSRLKSTQVISE